MATQETLHTPTLGEPGEACASCGSPLAEDQRYCLNCGHRRGPARVPFPELARERRALRVMEETGPGDPSPLVPQPLVLVAAASAVLMVLLLGVGVLLGVLLGGDERPVATAPPQVITVSGAGAPAAPDDQAASSGESTGGGSAERASFKEDWPKGRKGYTVSLRELPKAETEPAAVSKAKSAAEKKGAKGVGALDTDNYASLDAGSYLIYSGVYEDKKAAREALAGLKKDFPKASVARIDENAKERGDEKAFSGKKEAATVDRKQLKELQDLSSEEYSKRSAKVPNQTKIPGKAPKKQKERTNFEDTIK